MASPLLRLAAVALVTPTPLRRKALAEATAILRRVRPNLLIIGDTDAVEGALAHIRPHLAPPIAKWSPCDGVAWPDGTFRTLVVNSVDQMPAEEQRRLMTFNDESNSDVQVISIAKAPLFAAVEQGVFLERLYYQLNVLLLDLRST